MIWLRIIPVVITLALAGLPARAHDPLEITATLLLHTNRIELRAVMVRQTIMRVADHQGIPLLDFSLPAERDEALPMLRSLAPGLFVLSCGTHSLKASETHVILTAEDHVGFNLTYPVPTEMEGLMGGRMDGKTGVPAAGQPAFQPSHASQTPLPATLRLDARLLGQLPREDAYGVSLVVLDLVNHKVVEQKLLNAQDARMEIAPVQYSDSNSPALKQVSKTLLP